MGAQNTLYSGLQLGLFVRHFTFRSVLFIFLTVFTPSKTMSDDAKKAESSEHINLKVIGQDGSVVHFKIKKNTPLRKLMSAYCERTGVKMEAMRFRFDGQPINETDTPSQLDMEDGDSIDVFQQQTGGLH